MGALRCVCLRKKRTLLKAGTDRDLKEYYYRRGELKLERDLDIVNLLNMIKGYRVMQQVLFDNS